MADVEGHENMTCGLCLGPLMYIGQLGRRYIYRCRDCGMDWGSFEAPEEEVT